MAGRLTRNLHAKHAILYSQRAVGCDDVDPVGKNTAIVMDLLHRHPVYFVSSSGRALLISGARCWTIAKTSPESAGMCLKNPSNASRPPAEAPITTIRHSFEFVLLSPTIYVQRLAVSLRSSFVGVQLLVSSFLEPFVL